MARRIISDETREKLRAAGRKGGKKRAEQFTPDYQAWVQSHRSHKSLSKAGRKGYDALVEAGKADLAGQKAAEWRIDHPSSLELIVIGWLDEAGINYNREVCIEGFYADFVIGRLVIEVNGAAWHDNGWNADNDKDQRKYDTISKAGYNLLVLSEHELQSSRSLTIQAAKEAAANYQEF